MKDTRRMRTSPYTLMLGTLLLVTHSASAQPASPTPPTPSGSSQLPPRIPAPPRKQPEYPPQPVDHPDKGISTGLSLLSGSFRSKTRTDGLPAMRWNAAPIKVEGLSNAIYFEVARDDDPAHPFRSGVMTLFRKPDPVEGKGLVLRVCDIGGTASFRDTLVGLWAHPESFPALKASDLIPTVDMNAQPTPNGIGYFFNVEPGRTYPTFRDGAVTFDSQLLINELALSTADRGYDADGKTVWVPPNNTGPSFDRVAPLAKAEAVDGGLVIITLVPPESEATALEEGGEITVHYTGWLTDGTRFDSSRLEGREPFRIRVPGGVIQGWNLGLKGMAKGERRRLIIPPTMGYGDRGAGRGVIPPNSTLIFDVECMHVDNTKPTPAEQPPSPPPAPAPAATAPSTPEPEKPKQ